MTGQTSWISNYVDEEIASSARVYDYSLGGGHNFSVDRRIAESFLAALPSAHDVARLNRAFLRRAVFPLDQGVRQFLDIGSGIPTVGNVHEIIREGADVVYVDHEPTAVAHSQLMLEGNEHASMIEGDLHRPEEILRRIRDERLLNLPQPVGLFMVGVLHFAGPETDVAGLIGRYRQVPASGSYIAVSHFTADINSGEMDEVARVMSHTADPIHFPHARRGHRTVQQLRPGGARCYHYRVLAPGAP